jgi:hypothetical protein
MLERAKLDDQLRREQYSLSGRMQMAYPTF